MTGGEMGVGLVSWLLIARSFNGRGQEMESERRL